MVLGILISDSSAFSEGEFTSSPNSMLQIIDIELEDELNFGKEEWAIKVTIINNGTKRSNGRSVQALLKVKSNDVINFTDVRELKVPKLKPGETFIASLSISMPGQNSLPVSAFTIVVDTAKSTITGLEKKFTLKK
jgi:hypothetical protein